MVTVLFQSFALAKRDESLCPSRNKWNFLTLQDGTRFYTSPCTLASAGGGVFGLKQSSEKEHSSHLG